MSLIALVTILLAPASTTGLAVTTSPKVTYINSCCTHNNNNNANNSSKNRNNRPDNFSTFSSHLKRLLTTLRRALSATTTSATTTRTKSPSLCAAAAFAAAKIVRINFTETDETEKMNSCDVSNLNSLPHLRIPWKYRKINEKDTVDGPLLKDLLIRFVSQLTFAFRWFELPRNIERILGISLARWSRPGFDLFSFHRRKKNERKNERKKSRRKVGGAMWSNASSKVTAKNAKSDCF